MSRRAWATCGAGRATFSTGPSHELVTLRHRPMPLSPQDVVRAGLCIGCGSCVAQAHVARPAVPTHMDFDRYGQLKPQAPAAWLAAPSESFTATCPFSPAASDEDELAAELFPSAPLSHAAAGRYLAAYVGACSDGGFRES